MPFPGGSDGRSCAVAPRCSQEPTAAPWGARHPREAQTRRDLPRGSPLPTSPPRLPACLSNLWDKVPSSTPRTPDPEAPWSPASPSLSYHPAASPVPKAACTASIRGGTFNQVPAPKSCRESGTYMPFHVSSSLKTNLRTMPSKTPLKAASRQQALQRQPLVSGSLCPSAQG